MQNLVQFSPTIFPSSGVLTIANGQWAELKNWIRLIYERIIQTGLVNWIIWFIEKIWLRRMIH